MAAAVSLFGRRSISHLRRLPNVCRRTCVQPNSIRNWRFSRMVCIHRQLQTSAVGRAAASAGAASRQREAPDYQGSGIFSSFFEWLAPEGEPEKFTNKEKRVAITTLIQRLQDISYAKPFVGPDLEFFREAFHTFIEFNNRIEVDYLWNCMGEMKVVPDQQLKDLVESYLERTK